MITPDQRLVMLKDENLRFEQHLSGLSPADWERPSACGEWTVADVVAHIVSFGPTYSARILQARDADAVSQDQLPQRSTKRVDASPIAESAIALRRELGDDLVNRFADANRQVEAAFDQVGPADWSKLCYRTTGAETLLNILNTFIIEMAVHRWDVESPRDPAATLSRASLPVMVERYSQRPRWWELDLPAGHPPLPARFRFTVTDINLPGTDFVVAGDGEKFMEIAGDTAATVELRSDAETFILVAYGRVKPKLAISQGRLSITGSQAWADIFVERFVGG